MKGINSLEPKRFQKCETKFIYLLENNRKTVTMENY